MNIQNFLVEKEFIDAPTTKDLFLVRLGSREVNRTVKHYNLGAIIAVGYHVNSKRVTAVRQ